MVDNVSREKETHQVLSQLRWEMPHSTITIKLSAFSSIDLVDDLCHQAFQTGGRVLIDAEEVAIQDHIDEISEKMIQRSMAWL